MPETLSSLVPLLVCGASALVLARRRRRAAALAALVELGRRQPLPAPDEDLAIGRVMVLLDAQQIVADEYARLAPLYDEPTWSAPLI